MSLVLQSSGGGSVTLEEPVTASNFTITVPAEAGTMITTASTFAGTGPAFSAYAGGATGLTTSSYTKVLFSTVEFDTNSNFSSSRFTPTVAGYYQISSSVGSGNFGVGQSLIAIYKNGTKYKTGQNGTINNTYNLTVSGIVYFNGTTDYIEIYVYQASGGTVNTVAQSTETWFNGAMVRSA